QARVYYSLVQVTSAATAGANTTGYAGISIVGESLALGWFVKGAVPGAQLQMVMQVNSSGGATKSLPLQTVTVSSLGTAESQSTVDLDYGYYSIGLVVIDPTTSAHSEVLTSVPASAPVAIQSSST